MEQETYGHDTFLSPFTWRYGSPEMRRLWSEEHKRRLWRRVWVALAEAEHQAGLVSEAELDDLRAHQDEVDIRPNPKNAIVLIFVGRTGM